MCRPFFLLTVAVAASFSARAVTAAVLVHHFELNGNANDLLSLAPSAVLTTDGGSFAGSGYSFGANQGLHLTDGFSYLGDFSGDYSIVLDFQLDRADGFRKLIDFKDKTSDNGLYVNFFGIRFYNIILGSGVNTVPANTHVEVTLTHDTAGVVKGYVGNSLQFSFNDTTNAAVFNSTNNIARFFEDDNLTSSPTNPGESSAGFVDRILIYKGALAASEIPPPSTPFSAAVPEPTALTMWGLGAVCSIGAFLRKRWRTTAALPLPIDQFRSSLGLFTS